MRAKVEKRVQTARRTCGLNHQNTGRQVSLRPTKKDQRDTKQDGLPSQRRAPTKNKAAEEGRSRMSRPTQASQTSQDTGGGRKRADPSPMLRIHTSPRIRILVPTLERNPYLYPWKPPCVRHLRIQTILTYLIIQFNNSCNYCIKQF